MTKMIVCSKRILVYGYDRVLDLGKLVRLEHTIAMLD